MRGEKILVVDDQKEITDLIQQYLLHEGFQVFTATHASSVFQIVNQEQPDLILLDVLLPGLDGIEICKKLRQTTQIPILFISCRVDDVDKIIALSVGGDDYMTKPFSPREMVARVKAHLRRNQVISEIKGHSLTEKAEKPPALHFNNLVIDAATHSVIANGSNVVLSAREFEILLHLAQNPNRIYSIEQLFELIWGTDSFGDTRTVMVHISNLRKKLASSAGDIEYISTIRGVGYKFIC